MIAGALILWGLVSLLRPARTRVVQVAVSHDERLEAAHSVAEQWRSSGAGSLSGSDPRLAQAFDDSTAAFDDDASPAGAMRP